MTVSCDGPSCCAHDITRAVVRDGVLHSICLCCGLEVDADDMPVLDSSAVPELGTMLPEVGTIPEVVSPAIPCGDEIAHKWGWL